MNQSGLYSKPYLASIGGPSTKSDDKLGAEAKVVSEKKAVQKAAREEKKAAKEAEKAVKEAENTPAEGGDAKEPVKTPAKKAAKKTAKKAVKKAD